MTRSTFVTVGILAIGAALGYRQLGGGVVDSQPAELTMHLPADPPIVIVCSKDEALVDGTPPLVAAVWASGDYMLHRTWPAKEGAHGCYAGRVEPEIVALFMEDIRSLPLSSIDKAFTDIPSKSFFTVQIRTGEESAVSTKSVWWPGYTTARAQAPWKDGWRFRSVISRIDALSRTLDSSKSLRVSDQSTREVADALRSHLAERRPWQELVIKVQPQPAK